MREPPNLSDTALEAALQAHYGLQSTQLTFLPLGNDSSSSAYHVRASDGAAYYLKVRADAGFSRPSLTIPRYLHHQGLPHIIPPLEALSGSLWSGVQGFAFSVYPFVEGHMGADGGLPESRWRELGALVRRIHDIRLPSALQDTMPQETFTPSRRTLIQDLQAAVDRTGLTGARQELARFWHARQHLIWRVIRRSDALAQQLCSAPDPLVLCHADLHPWNVLVEPSGQFWLVDWDETILALKERDLMFVVGGIGGGTGHARHAELFLEGYGEVEINSLALVYYRYAWAVQDLAAYAELILLLPDRSEDARREALRAFSSLFQPGEIISLALNTDGGQVP